MAKKKDTDTYRPVLMLCEIRQALEEADDLLAGECESVKKMLRHLDRVITHRIGELVKYKTLKTNRWIKGVVVAYMVCEPRYICGKGDDRENIGGTLLACTDKHIRPR